jgi:hypothetical protein
MGIALFAAYFTFAVAAASHAMHDAIVHRPGRYRYMRASDHLVLATVALVAGLFWIVLAPVYLTGWVRSTLATRARLRLPVRVRAPVTPVPGLRRSTSVWAARG